MPIVQPSNLELEYKVRLRTHAQIGHDDIRTRGRKGIIPTGEPFQFDDRRVFFDAGREVQIAGVEIKTQRRILIE